MPIYAYRCADCGHAKDVLQKIADPVLTTCPVCGAESFQKQLTAAGFQLKGSGWYATDFKGGGAAKPADAPAATPAPTSAPAPAAGADGGSSSTPSASASNSTPTAGGCGSSCACH